MKHEDDRLHPDLQSLPAEVFALPDGAESLRAAILRRSEGVLRRRRAGRRLAQVGALAALYALGYLSARLVDGGPEAAPEVAPLAASEPEVAPGGERTELRDPILLEQLARSGSRKRRSEQLRRAGDLYLVEHDDVAAALRCYADYLALTPGPEHADTSNDTWLLAALKNDSH